MGAPRVRPASHVMSTGLSLSALCRAMALRQQEAERKKAMHDKLLETRFDVSQYSYLQ